MGNILSKCFEPCEVGIAPGDWTDWSGHPAARHYLVGRTIGKGGFSEVSLAKRKPILIDGQEVALKIIFLGNPKLSSDAKELLKSEPSILQRLHHPHIVSVRRTCMWQKKDILLIEEEMLHGEDVLVAASQAMQHHGFHMTESFAARVIRQVLLALAYLHSRKVLHRDIKTENLRLTLPTKDWAHDLSRLHIKIIDFGLSCFLTSKRETGWLGTPGYVAPEVIEGQPHSSAMDVYAAGVVLFMLLTGMKPMDNDGAIKLAYGKLEAGEYPNMIGNARWDAVSGRAQSLVLLLLQRDPRNRPSAQQALEHPFLKKGGRGAEPAVAPVVAAKEEEAASGAGAQLAAGTARSVERQQAAAVKETDRLQVDGGTVNDTIQAELWREVLALADTTQAVAGGSPDSVGSTRSVPADTRELWQMAVVRGYLRSRSSRFRHGSGRVLTAAESMPHRPIRRSMSLSAVDEAIAARPSGLFRSTTMAGRMRVEARPLAMRAPAASPSASSIGSFRGSRVGDAVPQLHQRAAAREQLLEMAAHDVLADPAAVEELEQLDFDSALPIPPHFGLDHTL